MQKIGRYEIKDELGAGGMGTVYRAFDPQRNRDVALKVINLDALRQFAEEKREEVLKRFYHEVRVIAQLQHIAIVPLFDSGESPRTSRSSERRPPTRPRTPIRPGTGTGSRSVRPRWPAVKPCM